MADIPTLAISAPNVVFHKLWQALDRETFLRDVGPRIRGLAAAGHARADAALLQRLPRLEIIANFGVGYDRVDVEAARRRGIVVTNTPDVLTEEVADLALALLLATLRELPRAERFSRAGHWPRGEYPLSSSLRGRTIGIVGLGRIGRAIARRLEGFGVAIAYCGRTRQAAAPYEYRETPLLLAEIVDTLILAAPATRATERMIDAAVLATLGPQGVLINIGRGSLVDEPALIAALRSRAILAAGLDVFANEPHVAAELLSLDNVVLLPHVGSASVETRTAMARLMLENLLSWAAGRGPLTPVPETPWPTDAAAA